MRFPQCDLFGQGCAYWDSCETEYYTYCVFIYQINMAKQGSTRQRAQQQDGYHMSHCLTTIEMFNSFTLGYVN